MSAVPAEATVHLRLRFIKTGKIRWTSHRDVARMWERALRRVGLRLAYSAGFSPRPKVSFGLALPTGHESAAEYLDLELLELSDPLEVVASNLTAALPAGLAVTAAAIIERSAPSLQEDVQLCTWRWAAVPALPSVGAPPPDRLAAEAVLADPHRAVAGLLALGELVVTRQRKGRDHTEDIRPAIIDLRVLAHAPDGTEPLGEPAVGTAAPVTWLEADLATQPRSIRPLEVLKALDPALDERQVRRLHQWILRDGARLEPLAPQWVPAGLGLDQGPASPASGTFAATDAPHALERAS